MDVLMATAKAAVAKTGHPASIFISQGNEVATWGLKKLNAIARPSLAPTRPPAFSAAPISTPLPGLKPCVAFQLLSAHSVEQFIQRDALSAVNPFRSRIDLGVGLHRCDHCGGQHIHFRTLALRPMIC